MSDDTKHTILSAGEGESYLVFSDIIIFKADTADTDGHYFVVEALSPPGSGPSFLHTHPPQETFYVVEGDYEIYGRNKSGKYAIQAGPGSTILVPGGEAHGFKNVGDTPGRMILTYEPAGPMQAFFRDIGIPWKTRPTRPYRKADRIWTRSWPS
jgi:mannose-6-phosphate isomerase-like protein (cupin superfamily)